MTSLSKQFTIPVFVQVLCNWTELMVKQFKGACFKSSGRLNEMETTELGTSLHAAICKLSPVKKGGNTVLQWTTRGWALLV